jgi:hypothetical protein
VVVVDPQSSRTHVYYFGVSLSICFVLAREQALSLGQIIDTGVLIQQSSELHPEIHLRVEIICGGVFDWY